MAVSLDEDVFSLDFLISQVDIPSTKITFSIPGVLIDQTPNANSFFIGFRLWTFPVQLVRISIDEKLSNVVPVPNANGTVSIRVGHGKSCLFAMSRDDFVAHLHSMPLFIMLLEEKKDSSRASKPPPFHESRRNAVENGENLPKWGADSMLLHGTCAVPLDGARAGALAGAVFRDCMGRAVGSISLRWKLGLHGKSLHTHFATRESAQKQKPEELVPVLCGPAAGSHGSSSTTTTVAATADDIANSFARNDYGLNKAPQNPPALYYHKESPLDPTPFADAMGSLSIPLLLDSFEKESRHRKPDPLDPHEISRKSLLDSLVGDLLDRLAKAQLVLSSQRLNESSASASSQQQETTMTASQTADGLCSSPARSRKSPRKNSVDKGRYVSPLRDDVTLSSSLKRGYRQGFVRPQYPSVRTSSSVTASAVLGQKRPSSAASVYSSSDASVQRPGASNVSALSSQEKLASNSHNRSRKDGNPHPVAINKIRFDTKPDDTAASSVSNCSDAAYSPHPPVLEYHAPARPHAPAKPSYATSASSTDDPAQAPAPAQAPVSALVPVPVLALKGNADTVQILDSPPPQSARFRYAEAASPSQSTYKDVKPEPTHTTPSFSLSSARASASASGSSTAGIQEAVPPTPEKVRVPESPKMVAITPLSARSAAEYDDDDFESSSPSPYRPLQSPKLQALHSSHLHHEPPPPAMNVELTPPPPIPHFTATSVLFAGADRKGSDSPILDLLSPGSSVPSFMSPSAKSESALIPEDYEDDFSSP
eukprot:ANDGO_06515.mRNA.1 hypothetical protein